MFCIYVFYIMIEWSIRRAWSIRRGGTRMVAVKTLRRLESAARDDELARAVQYALRAARLAFVLKLLKRLLTTKELLDWHLAARALALQDLCVLQIGVVDQLVREPGGDGNRKPERERRRKLDANETQQDTRRQANEQRRGAKRRVHAQHRPSVALQFWRRLAQRARRPSHADVDS